MEIVNYISGMLWSVEMEADSTLECVHVPLLCVCDVSYIDQPKYVLCINQSFAQYISIARYGSTLYIGIA